MAASKSPSLFARRGKRHTIILASGERVRHVTVGTPALMLAGFLSASVLAAALGTGGYLYFQDELLVAAAARQESVERDYEVRIAALRNRIDRVTSQQLVEQDRMAEEVEKLLAHQADLSARSGRLDALLRRAGSDFSTAYAPPLPTPRPDPDAKRQAKAETALEAIAMVAGSETARPGPHNVVSAYAPTVAAPAEKKPAIIVGEIRASLDAMESDQLSRMQRLADSVEEKAMSIDDRLRDIGLPAAAAPMGGPYIPESSGSHDNFDQSLGRLDAALGWLDAARERAIRMPLAHPASGKTVTSHFGSRRDPFLKRAAFHSGMDFRVKRGETVRTTGSGTVISAGRAGGYGNMVEIDHGDGVTTRYAHLSRIDVSKGQILMRGEAVGAAGSTGRSTGPHLHYEVRRDGRPIDPAPFLDAGREIKPLMAAFLLD